MTTVCWKSFCPKYALSGMTILKSFSTTVATPLKCPCLDAPQSISPICPMFIVVLKPSWYISSASGMKTASTLRPESLFKSPFSSFGYCLKSSFGPNCVGFIKMLTTVASFSFFDRLTRLRCPS